MEITQLAEKFIEQHNSNGKWSPFDRMERQAIRMFAEWVAAQQSFTPDEVKRCTCDHPRIIRGICECGGIT